MNQNQNERLGNTAYQSAQTPVEHLIKLKIFAFICSFISDDIQASEFC